MSDALIRRRERHTETIEKLTAARDLLLQVTVDERTLPHAVYTGHMTDRLDKTIEEIQYYLDIALQCGIK